MPLTARAVLTNDRIARQAGVNLVDFQTYGVLLRQGAPMTPGELANATGLPSSTTTRVLDRLERTGMVRREPDAEDRRRTWVRALPFEHPGVAASYAEIVRRMGEVQQGFTVAELETVARYLDAVKDIR